MTRVAAVCFLMLLVNPLQAQFPFPSLELSATVAIDVTASVEDYACCWGLYVDGDPLVNATTSNTAFGTEWATSDAFQHAYAYAAIPAGETSHSSGSTLEARAYVGATGKILQTAADSKYRGIGWAWGNFGGFASLDSGGATTSVARGDAAILASSFSGPLPEVQPNVTYYALLGVDDMRMSGSLAGNAFVFAPEPDESQTTMLTLAGNRLFGSAGIRMSGRVSDVNSLEGRVTSTCCGQAAVVWGVRDETASTDPGTPGSGGTTIAIVSANDPLQGVTFFGGAPTLPLSYSRVTSVDEAPTSTSSYELVFPVASSYGTSNAVWGQYAEATETTDQVAVGYRFETQDNSPAFRSFLIPEALVGDTLFEAEFAGNVVPFASGEELDLTQFDPDGVHQFVVRSIDPAANLPGDTPPSFAHAFRFMNEGLSVLSVETISEERPTYVDIVVDIRDSIQLKSKGVLPIAIISSSEFNAGELDMDSLRFGDAELVGEEGLVRPVRSAFEDVNSDGLFDLSLKFDIPELIHAGVLGPLSTEGIVTGITLDGLNVRGSDTFQIVRAKSVPEPSSLCLLCLAALGICALRRGRLAG